ncbi:hypothetical protein JT26_02125 [Porphyromonas sp. COT-108 OH1349]|nr:hypothetical protein JT26_02125 [Porphyromonas sp. COT-108 OH1349]
MIPEGLTTLGFMLEHRQHTFRMLPMFFIPSSETWCKPLYKFCSSRSHLSPNGFGNIFQGLPCRNHALRCGNQGSVFANQAPIWNIINVQSDFLICLGEDINRFKSVCDRSFNHSRTASVFFSLLHSERLNQNVTERQMVRNIRSVVLQWKQ